MAGEKEDGFVEYVVHNQNVDIGGLIVEDCKSYDNMTEDQIMDNTQKNIC